MLHAPNDARDCLRVQLGLCLGEPHHLHRGTEKVSGKKHNHDIYLSQPTVLSIVIKSTPNITTAR